MAIIQKVEGFFIPTVSFIGAGAITYIPERIQLLHMKKPLIVSDNGMIQFGILKKITELLDKSNIHYVIYDKTVPNPTDSNVAEGAEVYHSNKCDSLISLGGGSVHDCCKGIGLIVTSGGKIHQYEGIDKALKPLPPYIAINTTAGTASEITRFCIITDTAKKIKMAIVDWRTTPSVTINDPLLMVDMPQELTAATGMDALTHAVEAYVSINATPLTDTCAEKAISMIFENLRTVVANGKNIVARENMCYAQYLAGMAFNNAGLGYVHAMAHQLGGFYNLPHGECNALLLPKVEEYNLISSLERFKKMASLMGEKTKKLSQRQAAEKAIIAIKQLAQDVGIPETLTKLAQKYNISVETKDIPLMVTNAQKDVCRATNPKTMTDTELFDIYTAIW